MFIIRILNLTTTSIESLRGMKPRLFRSNGISSLARTLETFRTKLSRVLDYISRMCTTLNVFSPTERIQIASQLTDSFKQYALQLTFIHEHQKQHSLVQTNLATSLTVKDIRKALYHRKRIINYASQLSQHSSTLDRLFVDFDR